jgi:hypothetical protein
MLIENDHKGKYQSFSAIITLDHTNSPMGHYSSEIVGYGATSDEARVNVVKAALACSVAIANALLQEGVA